LGACSTDGSGADAKAITAFSFATPAAAGTINETAKTISVTVPYGTVVTSLTPTITVSSGATVDPASGTAQDFTSPEEYTVTAVDGSIAKYTVTVTVAEAPKAITAFSFATPAAAGTINETAKTISVTVPFGTVVTSLTPTITVSSGATVDPASGTAQDFTSPVEYTVTAVDGNTAAYTVTVTIGPDPDSKSITEFKFTSPAALGTINEGAKTISVNVPAGTNLTNLIPTITHTGASVSPASGTACNFSSPVTYTVTDRNGNTAVYTVTVYGVTSGQQTFTLVYPEDAASGELSGSPFTVSSGSPVTLTVSGTFDTYRWRVDGSVRDLDDSFTLNAGDYTSGVHQLSLEVTRDGVVYSKSGSFRVQP
jgi:hypothetical protein